MKGPLVILVAVISAVINAQDENLQKAVDDFFGPTLDASNKDPFNNLIEVTSPPPTSISRIDRCGEGSQMGTHKCVRYDQCDRITQMIIMGGSTNEELLIDRFGANDCEHFLDVCCGIPPDMRQPSGGIPVKPSLTSSRPDNPVNPPVTSVSPPVTVTSTTPRPTSTATSTTPRPSSTITSTTPRPSSTITSTTPRPSSLYCGIRNANGIDFNITENKADNEAEYGEFPWMVALLFKNFNPAKHKTLSFCGGSLIAPNVVLTGAHCVANFQPNECKIRAGEWDTQTEKERYPYQERDVLRVIMHENYTPEVVYNNIALLILSSPFDQADNIGTICLPSQDEVITSRNCFASGWGKNVFGKEGMYQVILKKIELPMIQHGPCQRALRKTHLGKKYKLHPSFICAGGELGKDTCSGDGGSPLVCPDPKNPTRYVQSGIVTWGIGCGEENIPGVYANVAKFRNWIEEQLLRLNINTDSYKV